MSASKAKMLRKMLTSLLAGSAFFLASNDATAQTTLPQPSGSFAGKVEPLAARPVPTWPQEAQAPAGAPNIVLILLDDVGYGSASVFGGPVDTPVLDRLARAGLRYNNFHVNAICSPTRASLLTGRNDHDLGFGHVADDPAGFPGYNTVWTKSAASIAEVLRGHGYSTAAFGKWHNTPNWEVSAAGPFDRWPTGKGFDYFYGFNGGNDDQFSPRLYRDTIPVEPPKKASQGYVLTHDLVNDAIRWLHNHDALAPNKPFFLYFAAPGTHAPHQAPPEWIGRFKGKFDRGWDKIRSDIIANQKRLGVIPEAAELTARPAEMPGWDSLSSDEKKLFERKAEAFAGYLAETDYEIGRVLDAIQQEGQLNNTLVIYIVGDNGASAEAGPAAVEMHEVDGKPAPVAARMKTIGEIGSEKFYEDYGASWAWAFDAPFRWTKEIASHLGGTTDPMVVYWPSKIKNGGMRTQWQHVTDVAPTIYEAVGIKPPESVDGVTQMPLAGHSFLASFGDPKAPSTHHVQVFESYGNRGIYKDGWWAGNRYILPWQFGLIGRAPINQHPWELYDLTKDFTQAHDLAAEDPQKLHEMIALFDSEAKQHSVYPLAVPLGGESPLIADRKHYVFRSGVDHIPVGRFVDLKGRSHSIVADVDIPDGIRSEGVIIAAGGIWGGFTLFVKDGRPTYEVDVNDHLAAKIVSNSPLKPGHAEIVVNVSFDPPPPGMDAGTFAHIGAATGMVSMSVNGKQVGTAKLANFPLFEHDTLDVGADFGSTVGHDYVGPFRFNGKIGTVTLDQK